MGLTSILSPDEFSVSSSAGPQFTEDAESKIWIVLFYGDLSAAWDFSILDNYDEREPYFFNAAAITAAGPTNDSDFRDEIRNNREVIVMMVDSSSPHIDINSLTFEADPELDVFLTGGNIDFDSFVLKASDTVLLVDALLLSDFVLPDTHTENNKALIRAWIDVNNPTSSFLYISSAYAAALGVPTRGTLLDGILSLSDNINITAIRRPQERRFQISDNPGSSDIEDFFADGGAGRNFTIYIQDVDGVASLEVDEVFVSGASNENQWTTAANADFLEISNRISNGSRFILAFAMEGEAPLVIPSGGNIIFGATSLEATGGVTLVGGTAYLGGGEIDFGATSLEANGTVSLRNPLLLSDFILPVTHIENNRVLLESWVDSSSPADSYLYISSVFADAAGVMQRGELLDGHLDVSNNFLITAVRRLPNNRIEFSDTPENNDISIYFDIGNGNDLTVYIQDTEGVASFEVDEATSLGASNNDLWRARVPASFTEISDRLVSGDRFILAFARERGDPLIISSGGNIIFGTPSLEATGGVVLRDTVVRLGGGNITFGTPSLEATGGVVLRDTVVRLAGGNIIFGVTSLRADGGVIAFGGKLLLGGGEFNFGQPTFIARGGVNFRVASLPLPPVGVRVIPDDMMIEVLWRRSPYPDGDVDEIRSYWYRVRLYSQDGTAGLWGTWAEIDSSDNLTIAFTIDGLSNDVVHGVQIRARNDTGDSFPSIEVSTAPSTIPRLKSLEYQFLVDLMEDGTFQDETGSLIDLWPDRIKGDTRLTRGRTFRGGSLPHSIAGEALLEIRNDEGQYSPIAFPELQSNKRVLVRMREVGSTPVAKSYNQSSINVPKGGGLPASPGFLVASSSDGAVELSWNDASDNTILEYQFRYGPYNEEYGVWSKILGSDSETTNHIIHGLMSGIDYNIEVRAINNAGNGSASTITAQSTSGGWRAIWGGRIENVRYRDRKSGFDTVILDLLGNISYLSQQNDVQTEVIRGESIAEAIWLTMESSFAPLFVRGNISSSTILQWWWAFNDNGLQAILGLEVTENGVSYELRTGVIMYDDINVRIRRLIREPFAVFSDDLTDQTVHVINTEVIQQSRSIKNSVVVPVREYEASIAKAVLWRYESIIEVSPQDSFTIVASHDLEQVGLWDLPIANSDYMANSQPDGNGSDMSSNIRVTSDIFSNTVNLKFFNMGTRTIYIINPQLRGRSVTGSSRVSATEVNEDSLREQGKRNITLNNSWVNDFNVARSLAKSFLDIFLNPLDRLIISFWAGMYPHIANTIDIDMVVEVKRRGILIRYRVLNVVHVYGKSAHVVKLELLPISGRENDENVFILDTSMLDTGTLGR